MMWYPVAFLTNGVVIVTCAGFELKTPVSRVRTLNHYTMTPLESKLKHLIKYPGEFDYTRCKLLPFLILLSIIKKLKLRILKSMALIRNTIRAIMYEYLFSE